MRPITPQPGYTESDVTTLMASGQFLFADGYTIIPKQGDPMYFTTWQQDVSVVPVDFISRVDYLAHKVIIDGLKVKINTGLEVDEQQINLKYPEGNEFQNWLPWEQALLNGRLDGARIRRDRYVGSTDSHGVVKWYGGFPFFKGLVSTLNSVGRQEATINVKSDLVLLNVNMPRDLFDSNCKNTWGDVNCGVNQADWAVIGTVGHLPTRSVIPWASASAEYPLGKLYINNFDSITRIRTISRVAGGNLYLSYPLDFDPVEGMSFTAYPGCNRTKDRCPHFHPSDWQSHFAGFPFVPVAETSV